MSDMSLQTLRLDDLYKMTAHIYADRNSVRSKEATFAHFVETCGMLTLHDRRKKRESFGITDALCKSLGWYFPLMSKLKIKSVESLIFRKFPGVCPYCREAPHNEGKCKLVKGTASTVDHSSLIEIYDRDWNNRPKTLDEWQEMFSKIYPRNLNESGRSTIGLMEELGELAEAIRVFDSHPHYFLGEAADTFSYLMGVANEHKLREAEQDRPFTYEREYISRYPGLCTQCGSRVCICPAVPPATIGRMAKELIIGANETVFIENVEDFAREGERASHAALENVGGYEGIIQTLPFDRGDANHGLVQLCLKMAEAVQGATPDLAASLRAEALKIGDSTRAAGTPRNNLPVEDLLNNLRGIWQSLDDISRRELRETGGLASDLLVLFENINVLFVSCNPAGDNLNLDVEQRVIKEAIKRVKNSRKIHIEELPAATTSDLRRALLDKQYDIIHFSGHADSDSLYFLDETKQSKPVPLSGIANMIKEYPNIKCVILNACASAKSLNTPISSITIGMDESIDDEMAIEFARGFYDGLAAGQSFRRAFSEGLIAVQLSAGDSDIIRLIE